MPTKLCGSKIAQTPLVGCHSLTSQNIRWHLRECACETVRDFSFWDVRSQPSLPLWVSLAHAAWEAWRGSSIDECSSTLTHCMLLHCIFHLFFHQALTEHLLWGRASAGHKYNIGDCCSQAAPSLVRKIHVPWPIIPSRPHPRSPRSNRTTTPSSIFPPL